MPESVAGNGNGTETQKGSHGSPVGVIAALLANLGVAVVKGIAAAVSGSSSLMSESVHSVVDTINELVLLLTIRYSRKPADLAHPLGYGRVAYLGSLGVSILVFALGAGVSLHDGFDALAHAHASEVSNVVVSYVVLAACLAIEGTSLAVALRAANREKDEGDSIVGFIHHSKDPSHFATILEDAAAIAGLLFAFFGLTAAHVTGDARYDAMGSIAVGILLAVVASVLLWETLGLLVGEGLPEEDVRRVIDVVESDARVNRCGRVLTSYVGPNDLLVAIDVHFEEDTDDDDIKAAVDSIERGIVGLFPQAATRVFIEAEDRGSVMRQIRQRAGLGSK